MSFFGEKIFGIIRVHRSWTLSCWPFPNKEKKRKVKNQKDFWFSRKAGNLEKINWMDHRLSKQIEVLNLFKENPTIKAVFKSWLHLSYEGIILSCKLYSIFKSELVSPHILLDTDIKAGIFFFNLAFKLFSKADAASVMQRSKNQFAS